jgi:hypothetical protein
VRAWKSVVDAPLAEKSKFVFGKALTEAGKRLQAEEELDTTGWG